MSNQTGFRQGRLGIGKNPIFPLDISGSTRIEGDLILGGTIADINGTPIEFGASSATLNVGTNMPIPEMTVSQVPSWSNNVTVEGAGKFVDAATAGDIYYNGGNIGIGTTSPDGPLDIEGNTNGGVRTFHKNLSTGTSSHVEKVFKAGDNELRLGVSADSYSDGNWDNGWVYSAHKNLKLTTPYNIIFCAGGASTQRMIINSSGNVGIGTTSPGEKLEVNGNIEISGSGSFRGGSVNSSTNVGVHLGSFSSAYGHIQIVSSNDNGGWIDFIKSDSGNADFRGRIRYGTGSSTPGMRFYTETSERMIIDNTGNVGIGTTSPGSQCKLQVYETGTEQAWKGRGVFGNETCAFVCGVYHNKIQIGGHNGALNAWYDIAINPGGGNVGIGTTEPMTNLDVTSSGSEGKIMIQNDTLALLQLRQPTLDKVWNLEIGRTDGEFSMRTAAGEKIRIKENGNVGIGTTGPNYALSFGQSHDGDAVWNAGKGIIACYEETSTSKYFYGMGIGSSGSSPNSTGGLCLWGGTEGHIPSNSNCHLFIKRNVGNVGIGTTSPSISLDVHGTYLGRYYNFGSSHDADKRNSFYIGRWDGTTQSGAFLGMQLKVDTHGNMGYGSYSNQASIIFQTWGNNYSTSREIMEITANGYVRGINAYQNDSDDRIKHNEKNINAGLNVINKLQAKEYFKTSTLFDENGNIYDSNHNFNLNIDGLPIDASGEVLTDVNKEIGFIAQEVFEIDELKHAVREGNLVSDASGNKYKNKFGLSYEEIFVMNVVATQELDRQQQADKDRIVQLETTVQLLMERITALENNATN